MTDKEVAILDDCDSVAFYQYSLPLAGTDGYSTVKNNVADPDPGSGDFLTPGSWMGKKS
jgi:hypothetical protein